MLGYFQLTQKPTIFLFHSSLKSGIKFCSYNIKKVFIQSNCFVLDKIDTFAPINSCTHHLQKTRVNHTSDRTNTHVYGYTGKHVTQVKVESEHMLEMYVALLKNSAMCLQISHRSIWKELSLFSHHNFLFDGILEV